MNDCDYFIFEDRISNLEKTIGILIQWINEISSEIRELKKGDRKVIIED
jgi:hypothetical protein